jgi:uncharacterized protein with WD repeat
MVLEWSVGQADVVLVEGGKAVSTIVVWEGASIAISRKEMPRVAEPPSASKVRKRPAIIRDADGNEFHVTAVSIYTNGTFWYSPFRSGRPSFMGDRLSDIDTLVVRAGRGRYSVPLVSLDAFGPAGNWASGSTVHQVPIVGEIQNHLVAIAGDTSWGRVAFYPGDVVSVEFRPAEVTEATAAFEDGLVRAEAAVDVTTAEGAILRLEPAASEVQFPAISWDDPNHDIAFRAALEAYDDSRLTPAERQGEGVFQTVQRQAVPVVIGRARCAMDFAALVSLEMAEDGSAKLTLADGTDVEGRPYERWRGFVGEDALGPGNIPRDQSWRRVNFRVGWFVSHGRAVGAVAFSPNGKLLASGSYDGIIKFWDTDSWAKVATLKGHSDLAHFAFSPDGDLVVSGPFDHKMVKVWDTSTWQNIASLAADSSPVSFAFSPGGGFLACGSQETIRVWETAAWENIETVTLDGNISWSVAFSPDGRLLAWTSAGTVQVWDAAVWKPATTLTGHREKVRSVAFSPDGKLLVSADGREVRVWDTTAWRTVATLPRHLEDVSSLAFSPDGEVLVSAAGDAVKVWDTTSWENTVTLRKDWRGVRSVAFSPDGRLLACGCWDKTVRVFDTATWQELKIRVGSGD